MNSKNPLTKFIEDLVRYLNNNRKSYYSVGGRYYAETGERDVIMSFLSRKLKTDLGISDIFLKCKELYNLEMDVIQNLIFYIDDCFDGKDVASSSQIFHRIKNYALTSI